MYCLFGCRPANALSLSGKASFVLSFARALSAAGSHVQL